MNDQGAQNPQPPDPDREPPNSTVDDSHGQEVQHPTGERQAEENIANDPPA